MEWLGLNRGRLGTGMVVFGLAGVVMAGIVAVALILGAVAARDLDTRLEADQARIAASLTRLSVTMESLATTTTNAGATLATSSEAMADARDVLDAAAGSTVALAEALDISILGSQPFAQASERLQSLALSISTFQGKAEALAVNLHENAADAEVMTGQIRQLKDQVNELASRIAGFDRIGEIVNLVLGGIVLAGLLTAWIAVAAAFCAWVGWKLRRIGAADGAQERGPVGPAG
jgi:DNA anti-recombination protein RmuC